MGGEEMLQRQGVLHQEVGEPDPCHSLAPAWPFGWPSASVSTSPYGSGTIPAMFVEKIAPMNLCYKLAKFVPIIYTFISSLLLHTTICILT